MVRPRVTGPKAWEWLWGMYEKQKAEIKQLKKDKEEYRRLAQKFGQTLQGIRSSVEHADPYAPQWREKE